jgi:hypothetical protein
MIMTYPKDPESGRYGNSYASAACPKPNPTPEEAARFREQFDVPLEKELVSLKAYADLDSSGFVSTDEASHFRMLYEFGLKAAFVMGEVGHSPDAVAKAMGLTRDQVLKSAASYNELRSRLLKLDGKALPVVKLDGSRT